MPFTKGDQNGKEEAMRVLLEIINDASTPTSVRAEIALRLLNKEVPKFTEEQANNLAENIVHDVCAINNPEGQPGTMQVGDQELFNIVLKHLLPE